METDEILIAGSAYQSFMGRWSRAAAREFLAWLAIPPSRKWLDVGCGTSALSAMILESASPSEVRGVDPSEASVAYAQFTITDNLASFMVGDALALPSEMEGFDVIVSGLVLNQLSRPADGVAEMIGAPSPAAWWPPMFGISRKECRCCGTSGIRRLNSIPRPKSWIKRNGFRYATRIGFANCLMIRG